MNKRHLIYYGILQTFHVFFLILLFIIPEWVFSFLNNYSDWNLQFIKMFYAISLVDFVNAFVSVFVVYHLISKKLLYSKLLVMTLSISVYSALIFALGINFNNLQKGNEMILVLFSIPFLPVFYFLYLSLKKQYFHNKLE